MLQLPNCKHHQTYGAYRDCKEKYLNDFKQKDFFCNVTFDELVKHFLDEFLDLNVWQSVYKDIKSSYETIFEDSNSPQNPREFCRHIAKEHLELESAPKEKLYELYIKVSRDMKEIASTIEKLQGKLQEIEEKKKELGFLDVEDRYRRNHINYYIKKNEDAKSKIVEYLREDIIPYILKAKVAVLTSLYEGFPNALIESIALGTPVVSFDCQSGPSEIIEDGTNGFLVEYLNVEDLATMLDSALGQEWDEKAIKESAKKYSSDGIVSRYLDVIND